MSISRTGKLRRTIIVGDIHSCWWELQDLLDKCQVTDSDRIISLGDMIDRGSYPLEVVDFFMQHGEATMGNHEENLLKIYDRHKKDPAAPITWKSDYHARSFRSLDPHHFEWFRSLPKFLRLPEERDPWTDQPVALVHAGCCPEVPLEEQTDTILMHASNLCPPEKGLTLDGVKHGYWTGKEATKWTSKAPADWPYWAAIWSGPEHIIFGHSVFDAPAPFPHCTGIDLGCCFNKKLCALILPDWKFVTVPARAEYSKHTRVKSIEVYPGISVYS